MFAAPDALDTEVAEMQAMLDALDEGEVDTRSAESHLQRGTARGGHGELAEAPGGRPGGSRGGQPAEAPGGKSGGGAELGGQAERERSAPSPGGEPGPEPRSRQR